MKRCSKIWKCPFALFLLIFIVGLVTSCDFNKSSKSEKVKSESSKILDKNKDFFLVDELTRNKDSTFSRDVLALSEDSLITNSVELNERKTSSTNRFNSSPKEGSKNLSIDFSTAGLFKENEYFIKSINNKVYSIKYDLENDVKIIRNYTLKNKELIFLNELKFKTNYTLEPIFFSNGNFLLTHESKFKFYDSLLTQISVFDFESHDLNPKEVSYLNNDLFSVLFSSEVGDQVYIYDSNGDVLNELILGKNGSSKISHNSSNLIIYDYDSSAEPEFKFTVSNYNIHGNLIWRYTVPSPVDKLKLSSQNKAVIVTNQEIILIDEIGNKEKIYSKIDLYPKKRRQNFKEKDFIEVLDFDFQNSDLYMIIARQTYVDQYEDLILVRISDNSFVSHELESTVCSEGRIDFRDEEILLFLNEKQLKIRMNDL